MTKEKSKLIKIVIIIIIVILLILIVRTLYNTVNWMIDKQKTSEQLEKINSIVEIVEDIETDEDIELPTIEKEKMDKNNPYWDYINMSLINVNFDELKKINSDTKGWIQVNGTNINYPFVQTSDNSYYLNHSFDKSYNQAGWVFLDYRNDINNLGRNTIIYAHGRADSTMFGSLNNILTSDWTNNPDNYIVKFAIDGESSLWQVFSVYRIPTTNDYIRVRFLDDNDFLEFANMLLDRSDFNFNTDVNDNDKILTLSTCYNNDEKLVLHAKLIKRK